MNWKQRFDEHYRKYKDKGYSEDEAKSYAADRANDDWKTTQLSGGDDRSMYGPE